VLRSVRVTDTQPSHTHTLTLTLSLDCCNTVVWCRAIDFGELLSAEVRARHRHTSYDLIANIVHDGEPGAGKGTYRVHILHKVQQSRTLTL